MANGKKRSTRPDRRRRHGPGVREWVGGRITMPVFVTSPEPYRPEMILWLEMPDDLVVSQTVIDPAGPPVSLRDTLLHATASPMVGAPRRPERIRVADAHLATELRGALPGVEVVVAPTPELDRLVSEMLASMPSGGGPSYLEQGRVAAPAVAALFQAAQAVYRKAPWKLVDDSQVLRLDIPALGVEGACVSIIGALGENLGLVIFPSYVAMERFLAGIDAHRPGHGPLDMGTTTLSLNFERGADLPDDMRREAVEHGWPVAGPAAYPWVQHRDRDGTLRPLDERDVRVVTACASGVAAFFSKYRKHLGQASREPIRERFAAPDGVEVRLAVPYEAGGGPSSRQTAAATEGVARRAAELHRIDERLVDGMLEFARERFGQAWLRAARGLSDREDALNLLAAFLVYQVLVDGKPVAHWFAQEHPSRLSDTERTWLLAQQAAWPSVWEVRGVEPGRSLELHDLLTGEVRDVQEVSASKTLLVRHAILARVVDYEGSSLLCGTHTRPLPPREAAQFVGFVRKRLRRRGTVPKDRLREEKMGRYLITRWEDTVEAITARPVTPPRLQNTDGESLLLTVDRFEFDPSQRREIEACLAAMDDVSAPESGEADGRYLFDRPGNPVHPSLKDTVLGDAWVGDGKLRVETNSVERADRLRERIEAACGRRIRHRSREHSDPLALMDRDEPASAPGEGPPLPSSDEANAMILDLKRQHYADWPDQPLPALGGKTARAAVRTQAGREQVDLLLKECEVAEARLPEGQRFDFSDLRRELGLGD
jgi:hypothetical protein